MDSNRLKYINSKNGSKERKKSESNQQETFNKLLEYIERAKLKREKKNKTLTLYDHQWVSREI